MKDNLLAFIEDEEAQADLEGIEEERSKALQYYLPNKPLGNEVEGRSQVVMRDVFDTVEAIMPSLLKIFTSGDEIVKFMPRGPEDVEGSEQESDYINHLVTQKNNAFTVIYDWIKDVLLLKNGYVKVSAEDEDGEEEEYKGLTEDELALIGGGAEIIEGNVTPDPMTGEPLFDVKVKKEGYKCTKLACLRPESVRVSAKHRGISLQDAPFVEHWEYKTLSDLREMGFDVADDISDSSGGEWDDADNERRISGSIDPDRDDTTDPASRRVRTREIWCLFDRNDDGIAERLHLIVVGREILLEEGADCVPIASLCAIRVPHRHSAISIADLVMEITDIRTSLIRSGLDQMYLNIHGRNAIDVANVNMEDMLTSRIGGIVRTQGPPGNSIMPLVNPSNGLQAIQMIEYMDTVRENRTGVTKYNQGMDSQTLNKTATGINAIQNASMQRTELIARMMAETGFKELFWLVHRFTFKYARKAEIVRLRNKWVPVDPREWKERKDMRVSVGLGMGNKDQQAAQIQQMLQFMMAGMQVGIVTPKNLHHGGTKYVELMGYKDTENWLTDPSQQPQQPKPDPEMEKLKMEGQIKQAQLQQEGQFKQQELQQTSAIEQQKTEAEIALKVWETQKKVEMERELSMMREQEKARLADEQMQNQTMQAERDSQRSMEVETMAMQGGVAQQLKALQEQTEKKLEQRTEQMDEKLEKAVEKLTELIKKPRKVIRDAKGKVIGSE